MKQKEGLSQWEKNLQEDLLYFLNMCGEKDRKIFGKPSKKYTIEQYARLVCISLGIGVRGAMLCIFEQCEDNRIETEEVLSFLDTLQYSTIEFWINEFIGQIENPLFKQVAEEIWNEKQTRIAKENFSVRKLF